MNTYKFLKSMHIDAVLTEGTINVGSLSHYRRLERSQWIADPLEGSVRLTMPEGMIITDKDNPLDTLLPQEQVGRHAIAQTGGTITFNPGVSATFVHDEVWLFSASTGNLENLTDAMCRNSKDPYDACLEILDIFHLAHRLFFKGVAEELGGAKMSDLFVRYSEDRVVYDRLSRDPSIGRMPIASPFLKDVAFADQQEKRIVFYPKHPDRLPQTFLIKIPRPQQIFREVFRVVPDRKISKV
jgi:hypothetical protein